MIDRNRIRNYFSNELISDSFLNKREKSDNFNHIVWLFIEGMEFIDSMWSITKSSCTELNLDITQFIHYIRLVEMVYTVSVECWAIIWNGKNWKALHDFSRFCHEYMPKGIRSNLISSFHIRRMVEKNNLHNRFLIDWSSPQD